MKKLFIVLLCMLIFPIASFAKWGYIINNYTRNDYQAGSQNWQIIQLDNHWMYFANKMGVLEFNGRNWNLYPQNNNTDARSLFYSKKDQRIYVGGINEFGYLAPDAFGKMRYHCLWDSSTSSERILGNIWNIFEIDNSLYFCEDHSVIKYTPDTLILIESPDKIDCSALVNNALHIGTSSGIFILAGKDFYRLPYTEPLLHKKLRAMLSYKNKLLIATARDGLFLLDKNGLTPLHTEVDDFIKENELFSIAIQNDQIAIGTVLKGVVLISEKGKLLSYINESYGLQNNTVLSTYFDLNGDLWLGLDNGIDYVALNYPVTTLYSSAKFYGAGYAARLYKNKLYLGTNRGLYVCEWPVPNIQSAPDLKLIEGTQGQVWNLQVIGDDLMMAHDRGLFIVTPDKVTPIENQMGVWDIYPAENEKNKYFVSNYNGIYLLNKNKHNEYEVWNIPSLSGSYINFRTNTSDELFVRINRAELSQVRIDRYNDQVLEEKTYRPDSIPEDFFISEINDTIVLSGQSGFYYYNGKDSFVVHDTLNHYFPTTVLSGIYRYIETNNKNIWALGTNILAYKNEKMSLPLFYYHNIPLISNFERLYPLNDSIVIIPNENGFALWDVSAHLKKNDYPLQITEVFSAKSTNSSSSELNLVSRDNVSEIPYYSNSLIIHYALIRYLSPNKVQFQTKLDSEPWSNYSLQNVRNLSNIPIGKHTFRVRTQLDDLNMVEDIFQFIILPPWYRTAWAYIGYIMFFILILFLLIKWDNRRIERKKHQLRTIQKEEIKKREEEFKIESDKKEKEIIRLKNEQLEMDVQYKSQKLATSALTLGRKNEVLIGIKDDLLKLFEESKGHFDYTIFKRKILQLSNKIDGNINEDDFFYEFEQNFDLVHNNFIKRLAAAYPSMSIAEQKMCAYIKMELSSKEIAPLLNISIRGVETLRYRLRKKLGLKREDSLTQFLMSF